MFHDDAGTTAALVAEYATLLRRSDAVVARALSEIVAPLQRASTNDDTGWLESFRLRYVDLERSDPLYESWLAGWPSHT